MGVQCFLVLVFMVYTSFALECSNVFNSKTTTCDECIRCDGIWCKDPNMTEAEKHCKSRIEAKDYWCGDDREHKRLTVAPNAQEGQTLNPKYAEVLAQINKAASIELVLSGVPTNSRPYYVVLNTTQYSGESRVGVKLQTQTTKGSSGPRRLGVTTTVHIGFCSPNSTKSEYVFVKIGFEGVEETATLKYHVPCACGCSDDVQVVSPTCSGAGTLTCGSCQCNDYTYGSHCEMKKCRGDIESSSCKPGSSNEIECSGNGKCDHCGVCTCNTNTTIQGSQYLVPEDNCQDICTTVNKCEECLAENEVGLCDSCVTPYVNFHKVDGSLLKEELNGRKVWVNCSVTLNCGVVKYAVSKKDNINVMVLQDCGSNHSEVVGPGKVVIPAVIGVIAALAAMVAAAAGYVAWKGKGALPTAGSNYANIEPEDSVGVNPLYKPPTSSFKNPMFGKS